MISFKKILSEVIKIDIDVGDTILTGRFKNKKTVVKSIGKDEFGMPTINGRKIVTFRKMKVNEAPRKPRKKGQHRNSPSHSDLYTDENPKGTIHGLKFATVKDAQASVRKISGSGKTHAHKIQAAVAMEQRAKAAGKVSAAGVYRKFINKMKEKTKKKNESIYERLLSERVDYYEIADYLRKQHKIKSKIVLAPLRNNQAEYNVDTDTMMLHPAGSVKNFIESVLHELHHAMMAKRMGKKRYVDAYEYEMNMAASNGKDPYNDNDFEIRAEKYAKRQAPRWMRKLNLK